MKSDLPRISAPAERALAAVNIKTLTDVSRWSEKELLKLHGFGPKGIRILKKALAEKKLSFKK